MPDNLFRQNAFRHSENVKFLNRYQVVFFDEMRRNFVSKIRSLILDFAVNFSQLKNCFSSRL